MRMIQAGVQRTRRCASLQVTWVVQGRPVWRPTALQIISLAERVKKPFSHSFAGRGGLFVAWLGEGERG